MVSVAWPVAGADRSASDGTPGEAVPLAAPPIHSQDAHSASSRHGSGVTSASPSGVTSAVRLHARLAELLGLRNAALCEASLSADLLRSLLTGTGRENADVLGVAARLLSASPVHGAWHDGAAGAADMTTSMCSGTSHASASIAGRLGSGWGSQPTSSGEPGASHDGAMQALGHRALSLARSLPAADWPARWGMVVLQDIASL